MFFLSAGVLLNVTPGPDTLYIIGRSAAQGRKAGMCSTLGISTGILIHTLMAACGLSAILANSATAFQVVKYLGAAYLIYLGVTTLFEHDANKGSEENTITNEATTLWRIYGQGVLTNVLNPKVALFFLSFLPQFVDPSASGKIFPFLFLGITFVTTGTLWCLIVAWFASAISHFLRQRNASANWLKKLSGCIFIGLGIRLLRVKHS